MLYCLIYFLNANISTLITGRASTYISWSWSHCSNRRPTMWGLPAKWWRRELLRWDQWQSDKRQHLIDSMWHHTTSHKVMSPPNNCCNNVRSTSAWRSASKVSMPPTPLCFFSFLWWKRGSRIPAAVWTITRHPLPRLPPPGPVSAAVDLLPLPRQEMVSTAENTDIMCHASQCIIFGAHIL